MCKTAKSNVEVQKKLHRMTKKLHSKNASVNSALKKRAYFLLLIIFPSPAFARVANIIRGQGRPCIYTNIVFLISILRTKALHFVPTSKSIKPHALNGIIQCVIAEKVYKGKYSGSSQIRNSTIRQNLTIVHIWTLTKLLLNKRTRNNIRSLCWSKTFNSILMAYTYLQFYQR